MKRDNAAESAPAIPDRERQCLARVSLISTKVQPRHQSRLAIVYVRQSSMQQVLDHRESSARQYALVDHASALGWPSERVLVIDEDQGLSGC